MPAKPSTPSSRTKPRGVFFGVGAMLGHVIKGVKTPVPPKPRVVREEIIEQPVDLPQGRVVLRRTVRDEVVPTPPPPSQRPKPRGS
ncbi:MAG: hypothetical protein GC200_01885 [Tepidisphaera sp.]|nr:hypothetical protein [Tepidisphaera sp.]